MLWALYKYVTYETEVNHTYPSSHRVLKSDIGWARLVVQSQLDTPLSACVTLSFGWHFLFLSCWRTSLVVSAPPRGEGWLTAGPQMLLFVWQPISTLLLALVCSRLVFPMFCHSHWAAACLSSPKNYCIHLQTFKDFFSA